MAELARAKGVRTLAGMQRRCSPLYLRLKELIEEGYIGDVVSCHLRLMGTGGTSRTSDRTWMGDAAKGANTMTNILRPRHRRPEHVRRRDQGGIGSREYPG